MRSGAATNRAKGWARMATVTRMPATIHEPRRVQAIAPRANPIAARSWGWKKSSRQNQTGGRQATRTSVAGSQPHRPRLVVRRNETIPASRASQPA